MKTVIPNKSKIERISILILLLMSFLSVNAHNLSAQKDGNWSTNSTWRGGSSPTASDNVTIESGVTLTVDVARATCSSLTFTDNTGVAKLVLISGKTLVITGAVTLSTDAGSTGILDMTNGGTLECGSITIGNGTATFIPGTGTIQLNATNTLPLSNFNNLIINSGTTTITANITVTGNLLNNSSLNENLNTISLIGTSAQMVSGVNFYDLIVNNSYSGDAVSLESETIISNSLILTRGIINASTFPITLGSSSTVSGASNSSHIKGIIKKIVTSNTSFSFPCGNSSFYRPIEIINPSNDTWSASYNRFGYGTTPKNIKSTDSVVLNHASSLEYWEISPLTKGSKTKISLSWDEYSNTGSLAGLMIAHWNNTIMQWENIGSISANSGTKRITSKVSWSTFSPFTFGSTEEDISLPIELDDFKATVRRK